MRHSAARVRVADQAVAASSSAAATARDVVAAAAERSIRAPTDEPS
jgi:hypothetical protein